MSCFYCGLHTNHARAVCKPCQEELPYFSGRRAPGNNVLRVFSYRDPIRKLINQLKFGQRLDRARLLADLMLPMIKQQYQGQTLPTRLLPVPLHRKRLRTRGYNQAAEIARPLAKQLGIKLDVHSLVRTRHTKAQAQLNATQRSRNTRDAFLLKYTCHDQHIVLLDDVMTTGHTIQACLAALKNAAIPRVDIWCCASTGTDYFLAGTSDPHKC